MLFSVQQDPKKTLSQIELIIQFPATYSTINFDQLKFALNVLVRHGIEVKAANKLLAKIADAEGDGLNACRYYHRAFKQGADFSFEDYTNCLTNLMNNNKWGEAKVICQKASAEYRQYFDKIPLSQVQTRDCFKADYLDELDDFKNKIAAKRQSK